MKKDRNRIHTGLLMLGMIFLFNPDITIIDVLPDFIGYIFLTAGLSSVALMSDKLDAARMGFRRMILCGIVRILMLLFAFAVASDSERESTLLLMSFIIIIIEAVVLFPTWRNFFSGFNYLGMKYDSGFIYGKKNQMSADKATSSTLFFIVIKSVCALLPEFSIMTITEESQGIFRFVGLLRLLSVTLMLVFGIVWLVKILKFMNRIRRDKAFIISVNDDYKENILPHKEIFIRRSINTGFLMLGAGTVLLTDFNLEYINVVPDAFAAVIFIIGIIILRKYAGKWRFTVALCVLYAVVSSGLWVAVHRYISTYGEPWAAMHYPGAYNAYKSVSVFGIAEAVILAVTMFFVFILIKSVIDNHTGFSMDIPGAYKNDEKIKQIRRKLRIELLVSALLLIPPVIINAIYYVTQPYAKGTFFEAVPVLRFAFDIVFTVVFCKMLYDVRNEVESRYMLS